MRGSRQDFSFAQVPRADIPRSVFNRNHGYKTTFDAGYLIPFLVDEVLPGDTFNVNVSLFARLATPIVPIMDNMYLDTFFFFVPNRLIWNNWEKFCGAQDNPGDSTTFLVPAFTNPGVGGYTEGSLQDYMGLPIDAGLAPPLVISLPFRAYNLIWNEWFRDQNLQNSVVVDKDDGPDSVADYVTLRRGKRHDYFTSALPWPQKGPGVEIPVFGAGATAPVVADGTLIPKFQIGSGPTNNLIGQNGNTVITWLVNNTSAGNAKWQDPELKADLASVTGGGTINDLREAFQIQKMYERDARGGTRYVELLKSHFGVTSPDARLQRPEFLGGGTSPVIVNPVAQTSETGATTPQGNLAAYGVVGGRNHGFVKSFVEHGYIIGLLSVRADLSYQEGLRRMWSRQTRFDFYWPALAHLGEQAILNKEINTALSTQETVWGYQERWAEYRFAPSLITGKFRSSATGSLDYWHLAQEFVAGGALNATFIQEDPPVDRVIAVPTEPHFLLDAFIKNKCARPMPLYSVPGLVDHF